ncbi:MAG: membrane protein [Lysobacteraceae bacterium]|nr:MAG: membrane protein [Xanthomonadaceae bacterium]
MKHRRPRGRQRGLARAVARHLSLALVYLSALVLADRAVAEDAVDPMESLLRGEFALQEGRTADAADLYAEAALTSTDPRVLERAAKLALLRKDGERAARLLQRWRELEPDSREAVQLALSLALQAGDAAAAEAAVDALLASEEGWKRVVQALAGEPGSLLVPVLLQRLPDREPIAAQLDALLAVGSLADRLALEGVRRRIAELAVERHPERARAWLWRADVLRRSGEAEAAKEAVRQALTRTDLDQELRSVAAGMLARLGENQAAAAVLAEGTQDDATLAARAALLSRAEDREGLAALYADLAAGEAGTRSPARIFLLGQLAEWLERPDEALTWYRSLPEGSEADQAQLRIAIVLDQQGRHEAAVGTLRKLQERDTEDGRLLIDAYLLEAQLLERHRNQEQAIETYTRGLSVFEDEPALLYGRALALERLKRFDAAEADLRLILMQDPSHADALNALGYMLAERGVRLAEAEELIRKALEHRPEQPAILDSLGWVLFRQGKAEEALPPLRRAFELQPDPEVAAHLGEVLWALGQKDEARGIWRRGLELDRDHEVLRGTLERHGERP